MQAKVVCSDNLLKVSKYPRAVISNGQSLLVLALASTVVKLRDCLSAIAYYVGWVTLSHTKGRKVTSTLHHMQKLSQIGLET